MANPFQGLILIDKPQGMTSHAVVGKMRKVLGMKAIGHAGTLDPMATGLLVLLAGDATKFSQWVLNGDKEYIASVQFGKTSDTWDAEGETLSESPGRPSEEQLLSTLENFRGPIELPVPIYSAIKKDGKKLYEYAREGKEIEEVKRQMEFKKIEFLSFDGEVANFVIRCAKGGYIRSFAHCLGQSLGMGALLCGLRRTGSEPYHINQALEIDTFAKDWEETANAANLFPMNRCLPHWPEIVVEGRDEKLLLNGTLSDQVKSRLRWIDKKGLESGRICTVTRDKQGVKILSSSSKKLLSLAIPKNERDYKIARVFKNN